jgi:hypothetical protein
MVKQNFIQPWNEKVAGEERRRPEKQANYPDLSITTYYRHGFSFLTALSYHTQLLQAGNSPKILKTLGTPQLILQWGR